MERDEFPFKNESVDCVIALDIIEHLVDSDTLLEKTQQILKKGGFLIITTPNFASLYNRLFLLLGYSFPNYHPSRYRTGNPFLKVKDSAPLWNENAHKSIFTLKELLSIYGFDTICMRGFSYSQVIDGGSERNIRTREHINKILPTWLKEGIFIAART